MGRSLKPISDKVKPLHTHPWVLQRKYQQDPTFLQTITAGRNKVLADLKEIQEFVDTHRCTDADKARLDEARKTVTDWTGDGPLSLEFVFDEHTGTKYSVEVRKR